jgi:tripartite-type tricarboxylate transporter receptor subunit TctC
LLAADVPSQVVHYRGGSAVMADLITGRVDFSWPTLSTSRAHLADKKLRALALDADKRWPPLPDVPTLTELGFGKEQVASWFALAAPAGTPPAIVKKLHEEFVKASQDPELRRRLAENGTPIETSTPEDMGKAMVQEWETMQQLVKTLNLRQQ